MFFWKVYCYIVKKNVTAFFLSGFSFNKIKDYFARGSVPESNA